MTQHLVCLHKYFVEEPCVFDTSEWMLFERMFHLAGISCRDQSLAFSIIRNQRPCTAGSWVPDHRNIQNLTEPPSLACFISYFTRPGGPCKFLAAVCHQSSFSSGSSLILDFGHYRRYKGVDKGGCWQILEGFQWVSSFVQIMWDIMFTCHCWLSAVSCPWLTPHLWSRSSADKFTRVTLCSGNCSMTEQASQRNINHTPWTVDLTLIHSVSIC